jgi:hypothetical protein
MEALTEPVKFFVTPTQADAAHEKAIELGFESPGDMFRALVDGRLIVKKC